MPWLFLKIKNWLSYDAPKASTKAIFIVLNPAFLKIFIFLKSFENS
jgi:hypothetical protein